MAPVRDVDFRLLAPFWRSFPLDILPYRLFFLRAKARISKDDTPNRFSSSGQYLTERFTGSERSVLCSKKAFADHETTGLASMTHVFSICERDGFMSRTVPSILADGETHMQIHPLMTLALRQHEFAVPGWVKHVVEVAYQRFWIYRSRHWPSEGAVTWEGPRSQLSYDFANYITACNFSLRIRADHPNVYFLKLPIQIAPGIADNARRMYVVLDTLERLLAIFGTPLAERKPSMLLGVWSSAFSTVKSKTNLLQDDVFSDARGFREMVCLLTIQYAATFSDTLGVHNDYSTLLEGIATNFLPHSDFRDVNLTLLRANRIRLLHNKNPSGDKTKALAEALGMSVARAWELRQDGATGLHRAVFPLNYDTLAEVNAADDVETIARVEQKLLNLLEDQLDGIDTARIKGMIYECLASLALKSYDFPLALQHTDTAVALARNTASTSPQGLQNLLDSRNTILELQSTLRQG